MEFVPLLAGDRQIIESYSPTGFRVSGMLHRGAILVLPQQTYAWPVTAMRDLSLESFAPVIAADVEILLLGCGPQMAPVPAGLRQSLRDHGIVVDAMASGAACRTFNLLAAEDRKVAAALLPLR